MLGPDAGAQRTCSTVPSSSFTVCCGESPQLVETSATCASPRATDERMLAVKKQHGWQCKAAWEDKQRKAHATQPSSSGAPRGC